MIRLKQWMEEMDKKVKPDYYEKYPIKPVDFLDLNNFGFVEGSIIKYVCRYKDKNGLEDLLKAKDYLDRLISKYKNNNHE